jgi:hypothetical protein
LAQPVREDGIIRGLGLAGFTETEDLVAVVHGLEGKFPADLLLERFQIRPEKFNDGITVQADEVIMVLIAVHRLIMRVLVTKAALPDQPTLHQEIQGPVDRGPADGLALLLQGHVQLVGIEVVGLPENLFHEVQAFTRQLQLTGPKERLETLLFLWPFHLGLAHVSLGGKSTWIVSEIAFYRHKFQGYYNYPVYILELPWP